MRSIYWICSIDISIHITWKRWPFFHQIVVFFWIAEDGSLVLIHSLTSALDDFLHTLTQSISSLKSQPSVTPNSLSHQQFVTRADTLVRDVLLACQRTVGSLETVQQQDQEETTNEGDEQQQQQTGDIQLYNTLKLLEEISRNLTLRKVCLFNLAVNVILCHIVSHTDI